jgi:hypothetical protein
MASQVERDAMLPALAAADIPGWRDVSPRVDAVVLDPDRWELALGHHRGSGSPYAQGAHARLNLVGARRTDADSTERLLHERVTRRP